MEKRKIKIWVIAGLIAFSIAGGLAALINSKTNLFKGAVVTGISEEAPKPSIIMKIPNRDVTTPPINMDVTLTVEILNISVKTVQFFIKGTPFNASRNPENSSEYIYKWNMAALADGAYPIYAKAEATNGNLYKSNTVTVTIDKNAPSIGGAVPTGTTQPPPPEPLPDFSMESVDIPLNQQPGEVTINATIKNLGRGAAGASTTAGWIQLSKVNLTSDTLVYGSDNKKFISTSTPTIAPEENANISIKTSIPVIGYYAYHLCANSDDKLKEELPLLNNNCLDGHFTISLACSATGLPKLISPADGASFTQGENITLQGTTALDPDKVEFWIDFTTTTTGTGYDLRTKENGINIPAQPDTATNPCSYKATYEIPETLAAGTHKIMVRSLEGNGYSRSQPETNITVIAKPVPTAPPATGTAATPTAGTSVPRQTSSCTAANDYGKDACNNLSVCHWDDTAEGCGRSLYIGAPKDNAEITAGTKVTVALINRKPDKPYLKNVTLYVDNKSVAVAPQVNDDNEGGVASYTFKWDTTGLEAKIYTLTVSANPLKSDNVGVTLPIKVTIKKQAETVPPAGSGAGETPVLCNTLTTEPACKAKADVCKWVEDPKAGDSCMAVQITTPPASQSCAVFNNVPACKASPNCQWAFSASGGACKEKEPDAQDDDAFHTACTGAGGTWNVATPENKETCSIYGQTAENLTGLQTILKNIIEVLPSSDFEPASSPFTISPGDKDVAVASFFVKNKTTAAIKGQEVMIGYSASSTLDAGELFDFKLFKDNEVQPLGAVRQLTKESDDKYYAKWEEGTNLELSIEPGQQKITLKASLKETASAGKNFRFYIPKGAVIGETTGGTGLEAGGKIINMALFKVAQTQRPADGDSAVECSDFNNNKSTCESSGCEFIPGEDVGGSSSCVKKTTPADGTPPTLTVSASESPAARSVKPSDSQFIATKLNFTTSGNVDISKITISAKSDIAVADAIPLADIESVQLFEGTNQLSSALPLADGKAVLDVSTWAFRDANLSKDLLIKAKLKSTATLGKKFALGIKAADDIEFKPGGGNATMSRAFPIMGNLITVGAETDAEKAAREAAAAEAALQAAAAEAARQAAAAEAARQAAAAEAARQAAAAQQLAALQSQINQLQQQLEQARATQNQNQSSVQINALADQIAVLVSRLNAQSQAASSGAGAGTKIAATGPTCEDRGKYTYTGPERPGASAPGMCIDCPTSVYTRNGGKCEIPAKKSKTAKSAKAASAAQQPDQQQTGQGQTAPPTAGQRAAAGTVGSAAGAGAEPALTGSQRLVRAPERSGAGPGVLIYFGILAAVQGAMIIRKKLKK